VSGIKELQREAQRPADFARGYLACLTAVLAKIDTTNVATFVETLLAARERGARIFFLGNGGSASTAGHFANDLAIGSRTWDKPFRAISLADNISVITALANDYGYEEIFVKQLHVQMQPGDVVVAISASGNSPNLLKAFEYANAHRATTIGLTGFDGGTLKRLVTVSVHVPTEPGDYGPAEDAHLILDHLVCSYLTHRCKVAGDF